MSNEDHTRARPSTRTTTWPGALRRRRSALTLLTATALLLTGCALPRTSGAAQRPAELPAEVAWQRELPLTGGVVTTEDVAVVYTAAEDGGLTLVGLSTADGATLWEHEAGRGAVRPSSAEITPAAFSDDDGSYVAFLEPDTANTSTRLSENRVAIADIDTGEILARLADRRWVSSSPVHCGDRAAACLWVYDDGRSYRAAFGPDSTELDEHPHQIDEIGGDISAESLGGGDWLLSRMVDGDPRWQVRLSDLPEAADWPDLSVSTPPEDTPWRPIAVRYSSVLRKTLETREQVDLQDQYTYLFDADTGETLWWGSGYAYLCPYDFLIAGVRCHATGVEHLNTDGPNEYSGLDLTLEGFADDGSTTWTLPLGDDATPLTIEPPEQFGSDVVVPTADGALLLDPGTGQTRAVPEDWTYLCAETAELGNSVRWDIDQPEEDTWFGGRLFTACTANGTPLDRGPSVAAVLAVGADSGSVTLVTHPGRLVAYDVTDREADTDTDTDTGGDTEAGG